MATRKPAAPQAQACPSIIAADLARSGLTFEDVAPYVRAYNPHPAPPLLRQALPQLDADAANAVLLFQYHTFDAAGTPVPLAYEDYARGRIYWKEPTGFAKQQAKDARPKYLQKPGTPVRVYIPPGLDWAAFWADPSIPLYIVEGEKKALALAARGLYVIGLGGVSSIAPGKNGGSESSLLLCPDLARAAGGRLVYIIFDLDSGHNNLKPEVARAAGQLASRLINEKAAPAITILRRPDDVQMGEKWAIDDMLAHRPELQSDELLVLLRSLSTGSVTAQKLFEIDRDHVYIEELDAVADRRTRYLSPVGAFRNAHSDIQVAVPELYVNNQTGVVSTRLKVKTIANAWLEWPGHSKVRRVTYAPGCFSAITTAGDFNMWPGWACKPDMNATMDDIKIFTDDLKHLHGDEDGKSMFYWYMYALAFPENNKQFVIPVLQSESEGVGKSIIPSLIGRYCYGSSYSILQADSLGVRLEFAKEAMFILFDDMKSMIPHQALLNSLATAATLRVDEKYVRSRNVPNTINSLITTNYTQPLKVTHDTRRYFFPHITTEQDPPRWKRLAEWFEHDHGGAKLLGVAAAMRAAGMFNHYDPTAPAPRNSKRDEMEELGLSPADEWVRNELPKQALREVLTLGEIHEQIASILKAAHAAPIDYSKPTVKKALATVGRQMGFEHRTIHLGKGADRTSGAAYAIKRPEYWRRQEESTWRVELNKSPAFRGGAKRKYE